MDYSKITNVVVANIDHRDAPDYVDAFIESADYDGIEMTDEQLDELNQDGDFVYEQVMRNIY